LLVVASMVGTGVFTTSGFLIRDIGSPAAVLVTWLAGGLLAICGALSYAELVAALPRNGGEYQLLTRIYHPAVGFAAGWISLVVGFSAPIAASELAGVVEIAHVASVHLLGATAAGALSFGIAVLLVSSVSAMIMSGPRVYEAMGQDHQRLGLLAQRTKHGGPVVVGAGLMTIVLGLVLFVVVSRGEQSKVNPRDRKIVGTPRH
jgi:amino acid transporter